MLQIWSIAVECPTRYLLVTDHSVQHVRPYRCRSCTFFAFLINSVQHFIVDCHEFTPTIILFFPRIYCLCFVDWFPGSHPLYALLFSFTIGDKKISYLKKRTRENAERNGGKIEFRCFFLSSLEFWFEILVAWWVEHCRNKSKNLIEMPMGVL